MKTELSICGKNYKEIRYVICYKPKALSDEIYWMHVHSYSDLEQAKLGLKKLLLRKQNKDNNIYKIRKFVITATDLLTDDLLTEIENRETCDCFYCGKLIQAGDELVFGDATEEIYYSHECVSKAMDNETLTLLTNKNEYLPWFFEKEKEKE